MDIQFWVWLIVIVITLIARANKKKPQSHDQEQHEIPSGPGNETKPVTFEDLLREIQAAKTPKPKQVPVAQPVKKEVPKQYDFVDYEDDLEDESKSLEKASPYQSDKIYETYENAKKAAFSRASLEETMNVEDTKVTFGQFKEFNKQESQSLASEYVTELRNPKNFKRALILSEILNKRF
jgi:hypothetical protein